MTFKMNCPFCGRALNVTEKAFGKTVPCPGCNQMISVSYPTQPPPASPTMPPSDPAGSLPPSMPPMPETGNAYDFLNNATTSVSPRNMSIADSAGLNFSDMFLGKERENVFQLFPDEDVLDEVTIRHKLILAMDRGITRIMLTNQRLLYTRTRVFSPLYWLLLVLFPPLIFYYAIRIAFNRNGSIPLSSVDSIEKRYYPNWPLFALLFVVGYLVALCVFGVAHTIVDARGVLFTVNYILDGVLAVGLLVVLLATRGPWMEIRSASSNRFPIIRRPGDLGGEEEVLDAFFQKVNAEVCRAKMLQSRERVISE